MTERHPTSEEIDLFALGADDEIHFPDIASHLADCDRCARALVKEARLDLALTEIAETARFCPGCARVNASDRCDHCGSAHAPGGFTVERVLVQTAHGRLYLARDPEGRQVALKELVFTQIPNSQVLVAFEKEAKLLQELEHPGVPKFVASFSEGEGVHTRLYLAQEFVEGASLLSRLSVHRFTETEALDIASRVLEILEYLHGLNPKIIHRDIKPANILQRHDGSTVLVDFGSARDFSMTGGATLVGTFGYIPPEQLVGMADETSDLYGLGASLAHLLTRRPPWQLAQGRRGLGDLNVSTALREFVAKLMAEDPRERFPSAAEAKRALDRPVPVKRFKWQRTLIAIAAAAIFGGSVFSGIRISRKSVRHGAWEVGDVAIGNAAFDQFGPIVVASSPDSHPKHLLFRTAGGWSAIKQRVARRDHTATMLNAEQVLIAGGSSLDGKPLKSAELCSLVSARCRKVEEMHDARAGHTATLLRNGSVLLVSERGAEVYAPSGRKRWLNMRPNQRHYGHTATLLSDGRVLVVGPEAEIFNPADGSWTTVPMGPARIEHTASRLADGTVVIAGGVSPEGDWILWSRMYDPRTGASYDLAQLPRVRRKAMAWVDGHDRVVLIGGHALDGVAAQIDIYEKHGWGKMGDVPLSARVGFAIQPASSDTVRLIGGVRLPEERLADAAIQIRPPIEAPVQPAIDDIETPDWDQAIVHKKKARLIARGLTAKQLADLAYRSLGSGRLTDAKDILTECVSRYPNAAQCHRLLGSVYAEIDDTRQSIRHYKMYLKLKPNVPDADRVRNLIKQAEAGATPM